MSFFISGGGTVAKTLEADADYFVDPATGDDSNDGTSTSTPWATIPGSRNAADSANLNTNSVAAGDIIEIKAGASFTSSNMGRVLIDSGEYANGTLENPIIIRTSATWGSGDVTFNASGVTIPQYFAYFHIASRSYIQFKGRASSRFVVQNVSATNGFYYQSYVGSGKISGNNVEYMRCLTGPSLVSGAFGWARTDDFTGKNLYANQVRGIGFNVGISDDAECDGWLLEDCEADECGYTTNPSTNRDIGHGVGVYGSINGVIRRVSAHDCGVDGIDVGTTANTNDSSVTIDDCEVYGNTEDGIGANSGTSGTVSVDIFNTRIYNNGSGVQWYTGVVVRCYHSVWYGNGRNIFAYSEGAQTTNITLRNCYLQAGSATVGQVDAYSVTPYFTFDSDYNVWANPGGSTADNDFYNGTGGTADYTDWNHMGANDVTTTTSQGFTDAGNGDFHLAATGPCHNAGVLITNPSEAATDADGVTRANPPDCGAYEYVT